MRSLREGRSALRLLAAALVPVLAACAGLQKTASPESDCIGLILERVEAAPECSLLQTLDRKQVGLQEFFDRCDRAQPHCILYKKFYYWRHRELTVVSETREGLKNHRIRAYDNPQAVCHPERSHPGRLYGDVAEFYDAEGEFMGLAVYMGDGLYFPLTYSGYSKAPDGAPFQLPKPV